MTTFSKAELSWIKNAIENDIDRLDKMLSESNDQPFMPQLIILRRDNLCSTLDKINTIISSNAKRIAVQ